jgi:hypothetical protein
VEGASDRFEALLTAALVGESVEVGDGFFSGSRLGVYVYRV